MGRATVYPCAVCSDGTFHHRNMTVSLIEVRNIYGIKSASVERIAEICGVEHLCYTCAKNTANTIPILFHMNKDHQEQSTLDDVAYNIKCGIDEDGMTYDISLGLRTYTVKDGNIKNLYKILVGSSLIARRAIKKNIFECNKLFIDSFEHILINKLLDEVDITNAKKRGFFRKREIKRLFKVSDKYIKEHYTDLSYYEVITTTKTLRTAY